jgi:dual specificity phosphatase 12
MNNMSWIDGQVAVSGAFTDKDIPLLKKQGINAVVDIRSERADNEELLKKHGMDYLQVKVSDTFSPSFDQLEMIMNFVEPLLDRGHKVLIHCQNGCGRSPLVVVVILVCQGIKTSDALQLIKQRHPNCGFTENQMYFLDNELDKFLKVRKKN